MSNDGEIERITQERAAAHQGNRSPRFFDDPNEEERIGSAGEQKFARAFGLEIKGSLDGRGDGGVDFEVQLPGRMLTIDVKTARGEHLLVKESELKNGGADIYVLAQSTVAGVVIFIGWEQRALMAAMRVVDMGRGIRSHARHRSQLRPMDQLIDLLSMRVAPSSVAEQHIERAA